MSLDYRIPCFSFRLAASLAFLFSAQALLATPMGLHVSFGDLYEFDVETSEHSRVLTFDLPVQCHQLTRMEDSLFCVDPEQFEGTWVRRLEPSSASVGWQTLFSDLPFPSGIAYMDSLLYVLAYENQPRRHFLLTLDPATGEELARVEVAEELGRIDALAARDSELWLLTIGTFDGLAARRVDPVTGSLHESFLIPGIFSASDADFGPDGRLFISRWEWNVINTAWCTTYWIMPFPGGSPDPQFSHCWEIGPGQAPPTLAYFTLAEQEAAPIVEIPTLGTAQACALAGLLALAGVLALRRISGRPSG